MRAALPLLLLALAACGGKPSSETGSRGRPEDVAKAVFEALKAGALEPLEAHLMTPEEAKRLTTVAFDDSEERERLERMIRLEHERLGVDWATAKAGRPKVSLDALGGRANVTLGIASETASPTIEVEVLKVGKRFVFQGLKPSKQPPKQAAPEGEEDGCGGD